MPSAAVIATEIIAGAGIELARPDQLSLKVWRVAAGERDRHDLFGRTNRAQRPASGALDDLEAVVFAERYGCAL